MERKHKQIKSEDELISKVALLNGMFNNMPKDVMLYIAEFPQVLPEDIFSKRWIGCDERMPDRAGWFLVTTHEDGLLHTDMMFFNGMDFFESVDEDVLAWMELPTPWHKKKGSE